MAKKVGWYTMAGNFVFIPKPTKACRVSENPRFVADSVVGFVTTVNLAFKIPRVPAPGDGGEGRRVDQSWKRRLHFEIALSVSVPWKTGFRLPMEGSFSRAWQFYPPNDWHESQRDQYEVRTKFGEDWLTRSLSVLSRRRLVPSVLTTLIKIIILIDLLPVSCQINVIFVIYMCFYIYMEV